MRLVQTKDDQYPVTLLPKNLGVANPEVSLRFETINDAVQWAEDNGITLQEDALLIGFRLGGIAVAISETPLNLQTIKYTLLETTDAAWAEPVRQLGEMLIAAAKEL